MNSPPPCGDSYALTDFESVNFKPPKQTAGPEFYDRSNRSSKVGLVGIGVAALVGLFCIVGGILIFINTYTTSPSIVIIPLSSDMATGFVHGIALRSALASEKRLRFNTNLRLLSAASGWLNPNNKLWNVVMAILLIMSYSSSVLVTLRINRFVSSDETSFPVGVSGVPLIVLGVALLSQAVIALACVWTARTKILTWSSSPFDLTAALVHHAQIIPDPGRCMRSVCDSNQHGPVTPSPKQPSAWRAHPSIRKVILTLWLLVAVYFAYGLIMTPFCNYSTSSAIQWSFFPLPDSGYVTLSIPIPITGGVYWGWALYYVCIAVIQGPLTIALHCSELIVNVIRDERMWRKATSKKGTAISSHPLASVFRNPLNFAFLLAKPLLHWIFGHSFGWAGWAWMAEDDFLTFAGMYMWPVQLLNYAAVLLIVSLFFTIIVFLRPKGPQPAAYGNVQTLANLIDEWSPTMWWGDKEGGLQFRHAGINDHCLPEVDMNALYA